MLILTDPHTLVPRFVIEKDIDYAQGLLPRMLPRHEDQASSFLEQGKA